MQSPGIFKDAGATGRKEAGVVVSPICQGCRCRKCHFFFYSVSQNRIEHKKTLNQNSRKGQVYEIIILKISNNKLVFKVFIGLPFCKD